MKNAADARLLRGLRKWDLVALVINSVVGAGIFGLPSQVYALAGDAFRGGQLAAKTAEATTGRVPTELARGWRNLCGIIAALTLAGTLATGTNSVLRLAEHQARTTACLAALGTLQNELFQQDAIDKVKGALETVRLQYDEYFP